MLLSDQLPDEGSFLSELILDESFFSFCKPIPLKREGKTSHTQSCVDDRLLRPYKRRWTTVVFKRKRHYLVRFFLQPWCACTFQYEDACVAVVGGFCHTGGSSIGKDGSGPPFDKWLTYFFLFLRESFSRENNFRLRMFVRCGVFFGITDVCYVWGNFWDRGCLLGVGYFFLRSRMLLGVGYSFFEIVDVC